MTLDHSKTLGTSKPILELIRELDVVMPELITDGFDGSILRL